MWGITLVLRKFSWKKSMSTFLGHISRLTLPSVLDPHNWGVTSKRVMRNRIAKSERRETGRRIEKRWGMDVGRADLAADPDDHRCPGCAVHDL